MDTAYTKRARATLAKYLPGAVLDMERDKDGDISITLADGRKFFSPSLAPLLRHVLRYHAV